MEPEPLARLLGQIEARLENIEQAMLSLETSFREHLERCCCRFKEYDRVIERFKLFDRIIWVVAGALIAGWGAWVWRLTGY